MEITASLLKCSVMSYFRFKKGYLVCTELKYGKNIADVIVIDDKVGEVIEIEVKISKSDLLKELTHKESKHRLLIEAELMNLDSPEPVVCPHKFYFAVPLYLVDEARKLCLALNKDYGVIGIDTENKHAQPEYAFFYKRQAHKLHEGQIGYWFKSALIKRICNDNIVFHKKAYWT